MKYKDGTDIISGDIIRWDCWDSDDYTTWTMTGMVRSDGKVVYLGGGVDFGLALGNVIDPDEVIEDSEANDDDMRGIFKVGVCSEIANLISSMKVI